jgi:hypothetical protein
MSSLAENDILEKLPASQPLKNFPTFYGTWRFITMFTAALYWSLSRSRSIQSIRPHITSLRSILILSSHLYVGLPSGSLTFWLSHQYPTCIPPPYVLHALLISSFLSFLQNLHNLNEFLGHILFSGLLPTLLKKCVYILIYIYSDLKPWLFIQKLH